MEKFSDVQKLKDLVDVASKVSNPRLSGVKIALNDIYEQELFDFGSKTGGPMWDKLRQILDRRKSPSPEEEISDQNPMIDHHDRDEVLNDPFMENPGRTRDDDDNVPTRNDVSEKRQTPLFNPRTVEWGQPHLNDTTQPATVNPAGSPGGPQPAPGDRREKGRWIDNPRPEQVPSELSGTTAPSGGPLSPPAAPGALPGASEGTTQVMPSVAPEKVGPVGSPEEGNAGESETAEAVAMDDKISRLGASLQAYVSYLQENIKAFAENKPMIKKINDVVRAFNQATESKLPLVKRPAEPQQEVPVAAPAAEQVAPNANPAATSPAKPAKPAKPATPATPRRRPAEEANDKKK